MDVFNDAVSICYLLITLKLSFLTYCGIFISGVKVFARSPQLARSDTPSVAAVQEVLSRHPEVDVVGLVQCTSPFLKPECKLSFVTLPALVKGRHGYWLHHGSSLN